MYTRPRASPPPSLPFNRGSRRPIQGGPRRSRPAGEADYVLSRLAEQSAPLPNRPGEREYAWETKGGQEGYYSQSDGRMLPRPKSNNRFR